MRIKSIFAWTGIFIIGIIPVLLLLAFGPHNYTSITHTLGQVSGLVGMTFFALTLVLSTRAKWIEDLFGGLDKVYPVHAVLGATSFILLLLHPLFLVMKYIPANMQLAARYILPGGLISVDFGIFALLGMIILLIITLYGAWKYQHWKFSHEFLGAFFILAVLHILLVRNTVARDNIFNGYYFYAIIVSVIGLTGFIYSLLRNRLKGKMYRINGVNAISGCFEILLEPIDELVKKHDDASNGAGNGAGIKFKSGQFVFVRFLNKGVGRESHPFSIAAPSGTGGFRIIVKSLGDFTSQLGKLHEGNKVIVEGPYGRFHNENHKKNNTDDNNDSSNSGSKNDFSDEIWVAGGIGITPFLGLAEDFRHSKTGRVDLYYSVKNKNEFVHLEELHDIARFNKSFRVFPWISDESGYLNIDAIAKNGNLKHHRYYLCGPVSLKSAIRDALIKKGIPNKYIHDERFAFK